LEVQKPERPFHIRSAFMAEMLECNHADALKADSVQDWQPSQKTGKVKVHRDALQVFKQSLQQLVAVTQSMSSSMPVDGALQCLLMVRQEEARPRGAHHSITSQARGAPQITFRMDAYPAM
jgi:hypothetical protein